MGLRWKIALSMAVIALTATMAVGLVELPDHQRSARRRGRPIDHRSVVADARWSGQRSRAGPESRAARGLLGARPHRRRIGGRQLVPGRRPGRRRRRGRDRPTEGERPRRRSTSTARTSASTPSALPNGALQITRSLDEVDSVLDDLRKRTLLLVVAVAAAAAAALGWLIAGTVAAPVAKLTKAAELVGSSGSFDVVVPGSGTDEVGRLGAAFRDMLGALALSRAEQHRLVQDAGPRTADAADEPEDESVGPPTTSGDGPRDARRRARRPRAARSPNSPSW